VYNHYSTNGKALNIPADIKMKALELQLMEKFHWLPQDIAKIPFKKLQEMLLFMEVKGNAEEQRQAVDKAKSELRSGTYRREV
jgi:hypothetical protein